jgi:SAM-dependent methyltransferase
MLTIFFAIVKAVARIVGSRIKNAAIYVGAIPGFVADWRAVRRQLPRQPDFPIRGVYPVLLDKYVESGQLTVHYFQQDLLVAQRVLANAPQRHLDIGSRIDGFVAHVATFRSLEILDIRPLTLPVSNVSFRQADLMNLPPDLIDYTDSISSLHVIEHFGLGRYGDPIDVTGHLRALDNIYRMLKPGGKFYFSTPVGPQAIIFNAHRVFAVDYLVRLFEARYTIDRFWLIDDAEILHADKDIYGAEAATSFGCRFGCGIFELTKLA